MDARWMRQVLLAALWVAAITGTASAVTADCANPLERVEIRLDSVTVGGELLDEYTAYEGITYSLVAGDGIELRSGDYWERFEPQEDQ